MSRIIVVGAIDLLREALTLTSTLIIVDITNSKYCLMHLQIFVNSECQWDLYQNTKTSKLRSWYSDTKRPYVAIRKDYSHLPRLPSYQWEWCDDIIITLVVNSVHHLECRRYPRYEISSSISFSISSSIFFSITSAISFSISSSISFSISSSKLHHFPDGKWEVT